MPTVQTNDAETYSERRGEGSPVVFVHGAVVDHSQWDPQIDALSDDYESIVYDVRGHGRTGDSPRGRSSVDLFADDLAALFDPLDVEKAGVCGLSMGRCIAQVFAARHHDRASGLVLADTFAPALHSRSEWLQRAVLLRATVPTVRLLGYERVERAMVRLQERLSGEGVSGDYEQIEQIREAGPKMATDEFAKVVRAVAAFHRTEVDVATVSVPTRVRDGENAAPFMRKQAVSLASKTPGASLSAVPGSGHVSNLDKPDSLTDSVRGLLERVYSGETAEISGDSERQRYLRCGGREAGSSADPGKGRAGRVERIRRPE